MAAGTWRSIALIFFFAELIAACHGKSLVLVGDVSRTFHVDAPKASWVIGAVAIAAAIGAPIGGWLIDRIGELRAIRGGLVIAMAASFAGYLATSFPALIACRFVEGIGYIAVVLGALTLLIRTTEGKRQTTALALWSVASPMGGALAILSVSPFVGKAYWQIVFALHSALLLGALALTPLLPRPPEREGPPVPIFRALSVYGVPRVRLFLFAVVFVQIFKLGSGSVLPTFLMTRHGMPAIWMGGISAASIILSVLGGTIAGLLFNRGASPFGVAGASALISGLMSALIFTDGTPVALVLGALFLSAISGGIMFAWITSTIPRIAPEDHVGATAGAVSQLLYLSMAIGPAILFFLLSQPGQTPLLLFIAFSYGLPLLLIGWQSKNRNQESLAPIRT